MSLFRLLTDLVFDKLFRVYFQRVIGRLKYFKILRFVPWNLKKYVDEIVATVAMVANLQRDLIRR